MPYSIIEELSAKYVENRSKFFSYAFFCDSEEKQREILRGIKSEHIGCSHVCFASNINERFYSSDDREPSGTAGAQIEGAIKRSELVNVLVVVVRYFGGVKLGTQHLSGAYRLSSEMVIDNNTTKVEKYFAYSSCASYDTFSEIKRIATKNGLKIFDEKFDENVKFCIFLRENQENLLKNKCFLQKMDKFCYF